MQDKLVRIGVFYDGNYFLQVSNYYAYGHSRKRRISISGLHEFIRDQVAEEEGLDPRLCKIVDAHYFRGRLNAYDASQRGDTLYWDRVFDDILMSEGVTTHYLPVRTTPDGYKQERGIDVWLALEAFEQAFYKRFDVLVLISSDGDYVPLVRKVNTLGTRVMALTWEFEYTTDNGQRMTTRPSQDLLAEVTYPLAMHGIIDQRLARHDAAIQRLFVQPDQKRTTTSQPVEYDDDQEDNVGNSSSHGEGEIMSLKNGYGFIKFPPNNLFFHFTNVIDTDFNELRVGDRVEFDIDRDDEGNDIAKAVKVL
ncbi:MULTISPECIES: NYN domain-containing protein [Rufibacter]|uniref:Cold shock CspA family protein n=1 Tax=Rufibacter quisquiliarum TaxID=1549639 RepID=A0A839GL14_9BACT|nr:MULTISPECIES: NYN domain-containing protein [Rufibacter]MBA9079370.1 cold shock CspA family protein [Rufibacter quisquiliarum]